MLTTKRSIYDKSGDWWDHLHFSHTILFLLPTCIVSDSMGWLTAIENSKGKVPGESGREHRCKLECMERSRTVSLCRAECICTLQASSRQVGWEGLDVSNLILDRKHPSPYVKVENLGSKTSGAWGLGLVMDLIHLHFLKLFDIWPKLN